MSGGSWTEANRRRRAPKATRVTGWERHGPFVSTAALAAAIRPALDDLGTSTVAEHSGLNVRTVHRVANAETNVTSLDIADRLIVDGAGDPSLWHVAPGLRLVDQNGKPL